MSRGLGDQDLRGTDLDSRQTSDHRELLDKEPARDPPTEDVRLLAETRGERDRGLDRPRIHHLQLPAGSTRERVVDRNRDYRLRGSEVDLLETVGQYRTVFVNDLGRETSNPSQLAHDLASLERQGVLETRTITRLHPHESADVVALTDAGKQLLDDHRDLDRDDGQQYYGGWVKPAELWHDATLYRMVRDVEIEVGRDGGTVRRLVLDDELKSEAFARLHRAKQEEGLSDDVARRQVALEQGLHVEGTHFVLPDIRLEIQDGTGEVRTMDLELVTKDYRGRHIAGKSRAGFRMFRSSGPSKPRSAPTDPSEYLP